ncbi:MAG: hypothetical protein L0Z62_02020 [Gemmataceae bacterium]|nr:hypothetical protein [Gemmataceae bacterium]
MKLSNKELEYLSAWAREEKERDPYTLPAHQLQARHNVRGVTLIRAIKSWARAEGRRDEEIFHLSQNPNPSWPWASEEEMTNRLAELAKEANA